jgi:chromate transporter
MVGLSTFYTRTHALAPVVAVFNGLQAIVVAIVANATVMFGKTSLKDLRDVGIALIAVVLFALGVSPILVITLAALVGLVALNTFPPALSGQSQNASHSMRALLIMASVTAFAFLALFFLQRQLFDLAAIMLRIDLFAFGGGFASVPLMFHEFVEVRSWIDAQTFLNGIALGQITPGPIVITATFVGYMVYGLIGAIVATVSVFLPSFLIIIGVTPYFDRLRMSVYFSRATGAILCSFVGLLLTVTFRFGSNVSWNIPRALLAGAAFVALLLKIELIWIVLAGIVIAVLLL